MLIIETFFSTKSEQEQQMAKRPLSAYGLNRAVTNFAKNAAKSYNPRFQVNTIQFNFKYHENFWLCDCFI